MSPQSHSTTADRYPNRLRSKRLLSRAIAHFPRAHVPTRLSEKSGQGAFMASQAEGGMEDEASALPVSIIIHPAHTLANTRAKVLFIDPKHHQLEFLQKNRHIQDLVVRTRFNFHLIGRTYGEFKLANLNYAQKIKCIKNFKPRFCSWSRSPGDRHHTPRPNQRIRMCKGRLFPLQGDRREARLILSCNIARNRALVIHTADSPRASGFSYRL